jgi:hypothetical protein
MLSDNVVYKPLAPRDKTTKTYRNQGAIEINQKMKIER